MTLFAVEGAAGCGLVTENVATQRKFASNFISLYDQETIEWE